MTYFRDKLLVPVQPRALYEVQSTVPHCCSACASMHDYAMVLNKGCRQIRQ